MYFDINGILMCKYNYKLKQTNKNEVDADFLIILLWDTNVNYISKQIV